MKDYDMNNDYLWDRSGEPNAEIQELERLLGSLRYQPQPLQLPFDLPIGEVRRFGSAMAIAAALALLALALSFWFAFPRRLSLPPMQAKQDHQTNQNNLQPLPQQHFSGAPPQQIATVALKDKLSRKYYPKRTFVDDDRLLSAKTNREPPLTSDELAQKEQIMVALRLASFKLNLAQRKTQSGPQLNQIRNQHKIG